MRREEPLGITLAVTAAAGANLVLRVEDNGIGLPGDAGHGGGNGFANMVASAKEAIVTVFSGMIGVCDPGT